MEGKKMENRSVKKGVIALVLAMALVVGQLSGFGAQSIGEITAQASEQMMVENTCPEGVLTAIDKGSEYLKSVCNGKYTSWWDVLATGQTAKMPEANAQSQLWQQLDDSAITFPAITTESKIGDYINAIMMSVMTGAKRVDAAEWGKKLAAMQDENGSFSTLLNQQIWASIALSLNKTPFNMEKARATSLVQIFNEAVTNTSHPEFMVDYYGMAALAYALLPQTQGTKAAKVGLAKVISEEMIIALAETNANSLACVIVGLVEAGKPEVVTTAPENGKSPLDCLLAFQNADGSFKYQAADTAGNTMATQQALFALRVVRESYDGTPMFETQNMMESKTVKLAVYGKSGVIIPQKDVVVDIAKVVTPNTALTVEDAICQGLDQANIPHEILPSQYGGSYISSINNEKEAAFGGYDGWLTLKNGVALSTGISAAEIENNDVIEVYYGDFSATKIIDVGAEATSLIKGSECKFSITSTTEIYDPVTYAVTGTETNPVAGVTVKIFDKTYVSDETGSVTIPATDINTEGLYTMEFSQWKEGAVPGIVASSIVVPVIDLKVVQPDDTKTLVAKVKKVTLNAKKIVLKAGKKKTLSAKCSFTEGTVNSKAKKLTWTVKNKKIASVKKTSTYKAAVKAKKAGSTVLTVKAASGKKATCKVVVKKKH